MALRSPAVDRSYVICDGSETSFFTLRGDERKRLAHITSGTRGRTRRGGFSAARYQRLHDEAEYEYVKRVCDRMKQCFMETGQQGERSLSVSGIFLAGKAQVKNLVANCAVLDSMLVKAVAQVVDVEHSGEVGLEEAVSKTHDAKINLLHRGEKAAVLAFEESVRQDDGLNT